MRLYVSLTLTGYIVDIAREISVHGTKNLTFLEQIHFLKLKMCTPKLPISVLQSKPFSRVPLFHLNLKKRLHKM
jgi:hypothetical protein